MSCITENTIVIKPLAEKTLLEDIRKVEDEFRIGGLQCIFRNKDYLVYIFDCNGDQPWEIVDSGFLDLDFSKDVYASETYYPEDGRWTQVFDENFGKIGDSFRKLITLMKSKLTNSEYIDLKQKIQYTYE